jgi:hypothetical protein
LKLAPILAQYLYANKRLYLPGIGTFFLDPSVIIEQESGKHNRQATAEGISFENTSAIKDTNDLIGFISSQTGKMKALATADLDSYLELAQQFLNIGKPFLFDGIVSLVKIKSWQFAFTSGQIMPEKMKEYSAREIYSTSSTEESFSDFKNTSLTKKGNWKWQKPVVLLLLLAGVALAIWGGYTMYKKTTGDDNLSEVPDEVKPDETVLVADTSVKKDSISSATKDSLDNSIQIPPGKYKFVIEVANKERGLHRFATLKSYMINVKMETADSVSFKLFFLLPASVSDTARIRDSLSLLYTPAWKKAFVEN